ncbi:hypothetical protein LINGRAHAP2_LOCUS4173 [Linum grandiflorum]
MSGLRCPTTTSSSPTAKEEEQDGEVNMDSHDSMRNEPTSRPNAWVERTNTLFEEFRGKDEWYVADSDSKDVAAAMREEDDMVDEEEDDPLCPQICFTAEEKARFQRPWRSALVVKGLDRKIPYIPLARRLNYLWAKHGHIQISDLKNGCYLV